ncbi:MAG: hypothetical protein ACPLW8_05690 [Candidatus Bathyarchaeales archaeon]
MVEVFAGLTIWVWRMKRKLKKAKATSEETAKKPEELDISTDALEKLRKWGLVKQTKDGRYYLSEK